MNKAQELFERVVTDARHVTNFNAEENIRFATDMSPLGWLINFKLTRISCGRATGKSNYIREYARPGDVILVPSRQFLNEYREPGFTSTGLDADKKPRVIVCDRRSLDFARGISVPPVIWIDEMEYCLKTRAIEFLLERFAFNPGQEIVAFG